MNINSYNVTDVGYHYIGLRVLAGLPSTARRDEQTTIISNNVRKYVGERTLRLMLPEPRGTFETAGEKICSELVHFKLAQSIPGSYQLTDAGCHALTLLNTGQHRDLRRMMAKLHMETYDNLRLVVNKHLQLGDIWRPVVDANRIDKIHYIASLLAPTFGEGADDEAKQLLSSPNSNTVKTLESALAQRVLAKTAPEMRIGVPMFRAMCDRLVSLRLINQAKAHQGECEFLKSYAICTAGIPDTAWYHPLDINLGTDEAHIIYFCEPDMNELAMQNTVLNAINQAFSILTPTAGYYDLPDVRDTVTEHLKFPEASFDEGLNRILDRDPRPLSVGLQYEGITGRRKPLARDHGPSQIYNLLRRA